jgi:uncharacterized protein YkwD
MRLVSDQLIDQQAAAAEGDPGGGAGDTAANAGDTADEAGSEDASAEGDADAKAEADATVGKTEKREFQCRRGGSPEKTAAADHRDTVGDAPADAAKDANAETPKKQRRAGPTPAPADDAPADDAPAADKPAADKPAADKPADNGSGGGGGSSANVSAIEKEIFETLNATRRQAGLKALSLSGDISDGARDWSCDMARSGDFRHADLRAAGVNGENIAWGYRSAADVHEGWMNSDGHRRNRMSANWTEYGIGVCEDGGGRRYYTERFR